MLRPLLFIRHTRLHILILLAVLFFGLLSGFTTGHAHAREAGSMSQVFEQAAADFGVPAALLKALCYMEGRLSSHGGAPSIDGGYGCMHLLKNRRSDTLGRAAAALSVSEQQLETDTASNIRGGAFILRDYARQLAHGAPLPSTLADWYGVVADYSNSTTHATALMYADAVYALLNKGFSATTDSGELITLSPQSVTPNRATAASVGAATTMPVGCVNDGKTDYPGAIDCILPSATYNCNQAPSAAPCSYEDANRPADFPISFVAIHDIEGTVQDALNVFQDPGSFLSIHYIVDSDGTIYQLLHEQDVAYQLHNYWYDLRTVGIEHVGFNAEGFRWYNAAQYLASARLTAYLLKKYQIPLDHEHVLSHAIVPAPTLASSPNQIDPGPYWLWDYYFDLIHRQGVPFSSQARNAHIISIRSFANQQVLDQNRTETSTHLNYFYLYKGPSTASGRIPQQEAPSDITGVTNNVETTMNYYYISKVEDPAGTGDTMYEIWYGEVSQAQGAAPGSLANAQQVWLAVPSGAAVEGQGTLITLNAPTGAAKVYGEPVTDNLYLIGNAPDNAIFVSAFTVKEDDTMKLWYEINYNHRQAWVPAFEVTGAMQA